MPLFPPNLFVDAFLSENWTAGYLISHHNDRFTVIVDSNKHSNPVVLHSHEIAEFRSQTKKSVMSLLLYNSLDAQGINLSSALETSQISKEWASSGSQFLQCFAGELPMAWMRAKDLQSLTSQQKCITAVCEFFSFARQADEYQRGLVARVWNTVYDIETQALSEGTEKYEEMLCRHSALIAMKRCPLFIAQTLRRIQKYFKIRKDTMFGIEVCGRLMTEKEMRTYAKAAERYLESRIETGDFDDLGEWFVHALTLTVETGMTKTYALFCCFVKLQPLLGLLSTAEKLQLLKLLISPLRREWAVPFLTLIQTGILDNSTCATFFDTNTPRLCIELIKDALSSPMFHSAFNCVSNFPVVDFYACRRLYHCCTEEEQEELCRVLRQEPMLKFLSHENGIACRAYRKARCVWLFWAFLCSSLNSSLSRTVWRVILQDYL